MKRPSEIRTAPRDWLLVLKTAYPFLVSLGIGDLLLFGSQALSVYLKSPLRSKDIDLVSSQIGPRHLEALRKHLETSGLETRNTTVQSKPLAKARMIIYTVELRLGTKPFFLEIFDRILDGQNPSILTPHAQRARKWNLDLWAPSPNAVVALRLSFRQPEGISRLNATRLNNFIQQNRTKLNFSEIKTMITQWGMDDRVKENLGTLHKSHRLRIIGESLLFPRIDMQPAQRASREMDLSRLRERGSPKKHVRPRLRGSPAEMDVREMRRKRFESLSGY
jgi:hypothetical protein